MDDPVKLKRETIKIEGGRNLYKYTFDEEDETSGAQHIAAEEDESERHHQDENEARNRPEDKRLVRIFRSKLAQVE